MKIVFDYNVSKMTIKLDAHSSIVQSESVWHANDNTKMIWMARRCMASRLSHWVSERLWCYTTEQYSNTGRMTDKQQKSKQSLG